MQRHFLRSMLTLKDNKLTDADELVSDKEILIQVENYNIKVSPINPFLFRILLKLILFILNIKLLLHFQAPSITQCFSNA